jgi:hypothetical protein
MIPARVNGLLSASMRLTHRSETLDQPAKISVQMLHGEPCDENEYRGRPHEKERSQTLATRQEARGFAILVLPHALSALVFDPDQRPTTPSRRDSWRIW